MKFKGMSRAQLFLIELIIVVMFFSFAGVVTVQVFTKAFNLAADASALNGAILAVQTEAETDKVTQLEEITPSIRTTGYTENWESVDPAAAVYTVTAEIALQERQAGTMAVYHYTAAADEKIIYELTTKKYYEGDGINGGSLGEVN